MVLRARLALGYRPGAHPRLKVRPAGLRSRLSAFFFYRDGEQLLDQTRRLLHGVLGARAESYLTAIGDTTRAVLYGLILTALLQGALAGAGYWAAGVQTPILLGVVTAVFALIPYGTPLVWGG